MNNFWVITPFFNPAGYKNLPKNHAIFAKALKDTGVNLLTVELTFGESKPEISDTHNVVRLKSNSVMWQKERLINYGLEQLPASCSKFAWVDCDVLFEQPDWVAQTVKKLDTVDVVQLFKRVFYLPVGHEVYSGKHDIMLQSVIWQNKTYRNWLTRRIDKELPFSSPGFGWAANRSTFPNGLYDRNIVGSGDTFMVDCMLDSWSIHGFATKFTQNMKSHMHGWRATLPKIKYDYIPQSIYHLWHGSLKNRAYMDRHDILLENDYDPMMDVTVQDNVLEWCSPKDKMHTDIKQYFFNRKEDEDV